MRRLNDYVAVARPVLYQRLVVFVAAEGSVGPDYYRERPFASGIGHRQVDGLASLLVLQVVVEVVCGKLSLRLIGIGRRIALGAGSRRSLAVGGQGGGA